MAITRRFLVDWDRDGFACAGAEPGDPLNQMTQPLTWSDFAIAASTGGTDSQVDSITDYGTQYTTWNSGANSNAYVQHGNALDSMTGSVALALSTAHTLIFWMRTNNAAYDAINFTVEVYSAGNHLLATSSSFNVTNAAGWVQIAVPFTSHSSSNGVYFRLIRAGTTSLTGIYVTGLMVIVGTYSVGDGIGFNVGGVTNMYDNLTRWVMGGRWSLGARSAYVAMAGMGQLQLTLNNVDKLFSPEYSSSPLAGIMLECQIYIEAMGPGDTTWTRMWTGWIDSVLPTPGRSGPFTAILTATDILRFLEGKEIRIFLLTGTYFTVATNIILTLAQLPGGGSVGMSGTLGRYSWPYVGDNWAEGVDGATALAEIAASERGFLYSLRDSSFGRWLRTQRYDLYDTFSTLSATMDNCFEGVPDYRWGDELYNTIEVVRHPRRLSASSTQLLWTLNENIALGPSQSKTIFVRYNDSGANSNGVNAVGAVPGTVASGTYTTSATINVSLSPMAQGCEITYTNPSGVATRTVTAHTLVGQRIIERDAIVDRYSDAGSIAVYGERSLRLDLKNVSARADQEEIGAIELARHSQPFGRFASVTITQRSTAQESWMVDLTISHKIRVIEDQCDHDSYYIIIGEEHTLEVSEAGSHERVTYFLEPAVVDLITP